MAYGQMLFLALFICMCVCFVFCMSVYVCVCVCFICRHSLYSYYIVHINVIHGRYSSCGVVRAVTVITLLMLIHSNTFSLTGTSGTNPLRGVGVTY